VVKVTYLNRIVTPSMDLVICLTCNKLVLGMLKLITTTYRIGHSNNSNSSSNNNNSNSDKEGQTWIKRVDFPDMPP
jgi:hypothetical protein